MDRIPGQWVEALFDLEQELTSRLVCAELEKVIWGQTRAETAEEARSVERRIEELVRTVKEERARREEERRREEEERKRKDLEFLNRNRALAGLPPLPSQPPTRM